MITIKTNPDCSVVSHHDVADIWFNTATNQYSLHAAVAFKPRETITHFHAATTQSFATYLTIQTGQDTHITLEPDYLQYVNHSCSPNVFFDTTAMQLVCLKPIQPGDELHFFYPSAEWEISQPFVCNCGSEECLQLINGAAHLSDETLEKYKLTDFILQQVKRKI